jgi:small subunit ribosomal protein S20
VIRIWCVVSRYSSDAGGSRFGWACNAVAVETATETIDHGQLTTDKSMPNTPSAKKRMRQDAVRRDRNRATKSGLRTQLRKVREAITAKEVEKSQTEFKTLVKKLDKAAAHRVIHPNRAARTKSRLSQAIKALKG